MNFMGICIKCKQEKKCSSDKSITQFHYRSDTKKFRNDCIDCRKSAQNETNKINREKKLVEWSHPMTLIEDINTKLISAYDDKTRADLISDLSNLYDEYNIEKTHPYKETLHKKSFTGEIPSYDIIKDRLMHHTACSVHVFRRNKKIRIVCTQSLPDNLMDVICTPIVATTLPEPSKLWSNLLQEIRANQIGYTYFMVFPLSYDVGINKVKIGYTVDLTKRLASGQVFNYEELVVYAAIQTRYYKELESFIHKSCEHRHVRGEWYQLSLQEIDTIIADFESAGEIYESFLSYRKRSGNPEPLFLTTEQRIKRLENEIKMLKQKQ